MLMSWLKLLRLPTVFTALSNICCGWFISHSSQSPGEILSQPSFWLLLLSSAGLYLGGMVLNDVCDAKLDAVERPERPIPSGRISRHHAAIFGAVLLIIGMAAALTSDILVRSPSCSGAIALSLAFAVLAYDAFLKNTVSAPIGMATCRFLNLLLGTSAAGTLPDIFNGHTVVVATALAVYVFGVTWFARNEAGQSSRMSLAAAVVVVMTGIAVNVAGALKSQPLNSQVQGCFIVLALVAINILRRTSAAIRGQQPVALQKAVGFMLLNIIFIDAAMTFCYTGSATASATIITLILPAMLLKRIIPMS